MFKADKNRLEKYIRELNCFNSTPDYGTTRVLFTKEELEGREYIKRLMADVGLEVTTDAIGNIFGRLRGTDSKLSEVWSGSHCDTVLNAGMFDGMAGVFCAIESLRLIRESGIPHKRDIVAVMYTSEEPTRFGLSCLGSRALCGKLTTDDARLLYDKNGESLYEVLNKVGLSPDLINSVRRQEGDIFAAVELHIEQSNSLEKAGKTIGIVKTICAPANYEITVRGVQSHAGGTSMSDRRDPMPAACELICEAERLARTDSGEYVTATVGRISALPGAVNVIPKEVTFSLDIRYTDIKSHDDIIKGLMERARRLELERGVEISFEKQNADIPAHCSTRIISMTRELSEEYGYSYKDCISGAYHDSLMVNYFAPVAMIFVPSKDGISHSPDEWTDFEDLARGTDILAEVLLKTANLDSIPREE